MLETKNEQPVRNPIITTNDMERWPLLEMQSQPCSTPITAGDRAAILEMDDLLNALDKEAAGLAAIQIGYPKRIFLLRNGVNGENNAYINPSVLSISSTTKRASEGCLSLPGMGMFFKRPKEVKLQYMDLNGDVKVETFKGFWARAVMHEMDHLNGKLIISHAEKQLIKKTSFGMKLTPEKQKQITDRRAKNKRAKKARRHLKAIGR